MESPKQSLVIIGGGIIGIACAHYLHRAGYAVSVVDQGRIGGACSHGNCGYVCPSHVLPLTEPAAIRVAIKSLFQPNAPFRVKPTLDREVWRWFWEFAKRCRHHPMIEAGHQLKAILDASMSEYRRLMQEESIDCEWKESGLLYVLQTAEGMKEFAETDALLTKTFGVQARRIEGCELPELDPALRPGLAGAFLYEGDTMLRPDTLCRSWKARLQAEGVQFVEFNQVLSIESLGNRLQRIITHQGPMEADTFVFATGAWSGAWGRELGCSIPIQPGKGYSVTMERPDLCPQYPMLFPQHRVGVTPFEGAYRLGSMMEFVGFDTSIPEARIQQLRYSAEPYLIEPHTEKVIETWYGWRPMTWDSLPVIGRSPTLENTFFATGHNMLGLSLAPATGRLLSELVQGVTPHLDTRAFSPSRFA
jgi:D-amino-acid dehydrogenase